MLGKGHHYTAKYEVCPLLGCSVQLFPISKKVSNRKCIVRSNKENPKTRVASYDKQPYFPGLWAGEEKKEENGRGKQERGNLGIVPFSPPSPPVSVVLFQSLVKLLQRLCVSRELKWILQMLICTQNHLLSLDFTVGFSGFFESVCL